MANMDFVFNSMPKLDRKATTLSEWLTKLEHRFTLAGIDEDIKKISLCALFVGQTGEDILLGIDPDTTWEDAKGMLADRMGEGSTAEEAWQALKKVTRGNMELVDLGALVEKLARRAYPDQEETIQRHAIEAFVRAIEGPLAREILKQGHQTLSDVVAAARRIERLEKEYPSPSLASFSNVLKDGLQQLKQELKEGQSTEVAARLAQAVPTEARACATLPTSRYTGPPPGFAPTPRRFHPAPSPSCYLCDDQGHFIRDCPLREAFRQFRLQHSNQPRPRHPGGAGPPGADAQTPGVHLN